MGCDMFEKTMLIFRGYRAGMVRCDKELKFCVHTPKGHSEWPTFYGNPGRRVGYDNPERIPKYIRKEVKRLWYG